MRSFRDIHPTRHVGIVENLAVIDDKQIKDRQPMDRLGDGTHAT